MTYKKRFIDDKGNFIIELHYDDGRVQEVSKHQDLFLKWTEEGNIPEEIAHVPPVNDDDSNNQEQLPLDQLKNQIYESINSFTGQIILDGIDIKGIRLKLDEHRQRDLQALYSRRFDMPYPFIIWEGFDKISLNDPEEVKMICESVFDFIYSTRYEGMKLREKVKKYTRKQCESFKDPREV